MSKDTVSFAKLEAQVIACRKCERLVQWREQIGSIRRKAFRDEDYWAKPVPGFGDHQARVMIIGLAPGAHGSNRTGRMFTGDDSGKFLYPALWRAGFVNQPDGMRVDDGLILQSIWITAVCRCVPPGNKPTSSEIKNCHHYLETEIGLQKSLQGIVALGRIVWDEVLKWYHPEYSQSIPQFSHGALIEKVDHKPWVLASYHPSRQNTQTGRLTAAMFDEIWKKVNDLLG